MGCLNIALEKLKIAHKVTLHLSSRALWQPAEREQTASLCLNNRGDAGRALTATEMFAFFQNVTFGHVIQRNTFPAHRNAIH